LLSSFNYFISLENIKLFISNSIHQIEYTNDKFNKNRLLRLFSLFLINFIRNYNYNQHFHFDLISLFNDLFFLKTFLTSYLKIDEVVSLLKEIEKIK
jgi:hypothetical protein